MFVLFTIIAYVILYIGVYIGLCIGGVNMADTLKNRVRFSTTLDKETLKVLREYSEKTMIPITKIIDSAILEYIKKRD